MAVASVAGDVVTALAAVAVVVEAAVGILLVGWVAVGVGFESQYVGQFVSWMPPMILGCFSAADVGSVLALSRGLRTWCPTVFMRWTSSKKLPVLLCSWEFWAMGSAFVFVVDCFC